MLLLFFHVPKTGGTTVHKDLRQTFGSAYLRSILNRGRGGHEFLTDQDIREHLAPQSVGMVAVSGHLLRYPVTLPDRHLVCTTVIRDPFDWALSHYFHALRKGWVPGETSFECYLSEHYGLGNYQTHHFASSARAVDAVKALEAFEIVGVTDQLHSYRALLASFVEREMGLPMRICQRAENVASNRTRTALQLTAREQRIVLDVLGEDVKLYHYASARHRQDTRRNWTAHQALRLGLDRRETAL